MKRWTLFGVLAMAVIVGLMVTSILEPGIDAAGSSYHGTAPFTITVDSTVAKQRDTINTLSELIGGAAGATGVIFRYDDAAHYSTVLSRILIEYTAVDTGTGGTYVDTTKDTVIVVIKTADQYMNAWKEVRRDTLAAFHVTASVVNTDYVWRTLSDSVLAANVYYEFIVALQDSASTKARLSAGIDYKATVDIWAK